MSSKDSYLFFRLRTLKKSYVHVIAIGEIIQTESCS